jgi:hypothetical protein
VEKQSIILFLISIIGGLITFHLGSYILVKLIRKRIIRNMILGGGLLLLNCIYFVSIIKLNSDFQEYIFLYVVLPFFAEIFLSIGILFFIMSKIEKKVIKLSEFILYILVGALFIALVIGACIAIKMGKIVSDVISNFFIIPLDAMLIGEMIRNKISTKK